MKKYFLLLLVLFHVTFVASQTTCDNAPFVCSGGINPKPNVVGVASLGKPACLTSAPNPNWYIFKTDNSGDLRFNLTQSTNAIPPQPIDIDFACWGPFPIKPNCSNFNLSSCGSCPGDNFTLIPPYVHTTGVYPIGNIIDCSYSSRATEELVIPNAASGVYYILLITNFSGVQGTFQLTQTNLNAGGAGTSDCEPACGVALGETAATIFPNPEINTISTCDPAITSQILHCNFYSPPANQASLSYKWYLNDVLVPSLTTKSVTVTQSGTWKVEVVHPDCNSASSDAVIINFGTVPVVNTIATLQGALGDCNPTFNLDALKQALVAPLNANDYNVSFYTNPIDADFLTNPITNSSAFPTNSDVIIYVRAINKISNCADESSASFSLDVRCVNSASATGSTICQTGTNTGTLTFSGTPGGRVYFDNDAVLPNYFVDLDATGNAVWTSPVLLANTTYTLGDFVGGTPVVTVNLGTTATINVVTVPKAGTGTPKAFCSSDAPADLYASITGPKDPGGVWSPALASGTGVYNPTVDNPGTYTYSFNLVGCTPSSTTVVVTESLQPNAGTDGNVTICESRTTAINLYDYLTAAQNGGVWSVDATSTGVGGTFNSAAGTYLPAIGATNYVFRYTIAGSSPCNPDFSLVNVTVTASPKAGTGTPKAFCSSDAPADLYASITGPKDPGGVWSPALASGTGVYNPAVDSPGNYEYKFDLLGCTPSSTTVVVTESLQPNAGTDGNVTICESRTTAINLYDYLTGAQNGGIWSIDATSTGVGGTFNSAAGTYLPAIGATNYVFRYTIAGSSPCNSDFSLVNVTIDKQPNAGISASPLVQCASDFTPVNLFNGIVGEQPLGTWTRLSGSGGFFNAVTGLFTPDVTTSAVSTFQYSFAANGSCSGSSSVVTVNISPIPTGVSITGSSVVCAGANTNITLSATPGAILTWNGIPNLVTIPASGSVVLVQNPLSDITYSVTNASLNGCGINVSGVSLFVDTENTPQFLNANILDYAICNGDNLNLKTLLASTVSGANLEWNAVYGVNVLNPGIAQPGDSSNIDYTVNLVNPNLPGTITITVKPVLGDCKGVSQDIVVTVNTMPVIQQVSVLPATVCNGNATVLTINALPTAANYDWEVSDVNGVVLSNGNTSGTTTSNVLTINLDLVNPLQAGRIKFKITPKNGTCVGQAFKTEFIEVNPIPGKPIFLADKEICSGEKTDLTISAFPNIAQTMFEYTVIDSFNVTGALSSTSLHLAPIHLNDKLENNSDVRGFVKYRVQTVLGTCKGDFTDYIVYVNPAPKPKLIDGYICVDKATGIAFQEYVLDTHLSNPNYIYSWFVLDELSNVYEPIVAANSATFKVVKKGKYKVVVTNRITTCKNEYVAIVEEVFPATDFTFDVTDAFANNAIITVDVNPMGTGVLIYALDGGSFQNSNVFTNVAAGEHEIMVEDEEGCTKISKLITVIDYPKYFTPNGDGYNDFWNIGGLEEKHSATVLIFDRYGKLIKQINPLHKGWDGLYNGKQMPASDYWFTVDYTEKNTKKQFKSHFSLKR